MEYSYIYTCMYMYMHAHIRTCVHDMGYTHVVHVPAVLHTGMDLVAADSVSCSEGGNRHYMTHIFIR